MFLTVPFNSPWARSGEVLIQPKQKCLSPRWALEEHQGSDLNHSLAAWFSRSWTPELLPLDGLHCPLPHPLHALLHCYLLGQNHPRLRRLCRFHGPDGKLLGILVPAPPHPLLPCLLLPPTVRGWPSFSVSFLLMALPVNAAEGLRQLLGKTWLGSRSARSWGSHHRNRATINQRRKLTAWGHPQLLFLTSVPTPRTVLPTVTRT